MPILSVSTHSRPKAAGVAILYRSLNLWFQLTAARRRLDRNMGQHRHRFGFNSQPPEGGWRLGKQGQLVHQRFNSQPPEGGWAQKPARKSSAKMFQLTAARRRLDAGSYSRADPQLFQLTAARRRLGTVTGTSVYIERRFNSQPPEGGWEPPSSESEPPSSVSTHSRPKAAGCNTRESVC